MEFEAGNTSLMSLFGYGEQKNCASRDMYLKCIACFYIFEVGVGKLLYKKGHEKKKEKNSFNYLLWVLSMNMWP